MVFVQWRKMQIWKANPMPRAHNREGGGSQPTYPLPPSLLCKVFIIWKLAPRRDEIQRLRTVYKSRHNFQKGAMALETIQKKLEAGHVRENIHHYYAVWKSYFRYIQKTRHGGRAVSDNRIVAALMLQQDSFSAELHVSASRGKPIITIYGHITLDSTPLGHGLPRETHRANGSSDEEYGCIGRL
jgi:hypothetical protein